MIQASESSHLPSKDKIKTQLQLIQYSLSILRERIEAATEPIGIMLSEIENDLGNINEKVFAAVTSIKPISITPASKFTNPMTSMAKYFPIMLDLEKFSGNRSVLVEVLKGLTFEERALMSSVSIEHNEMYEDVYLKFQEVESKIVQEVIEMGLSPPYDEASFLTNVEDRIRRAWQFDEFQSKLLKMRIRRYRIEAVIEELTQDRNKAKLSGPTCEAPSVVNQASSSRNGGAAE
ncbi:hypothetical protein PTTG_29215 [Puccinia triticina 1-1 BBBD Race 1]|uniref:Uncharacterized protein n=1 Tax=Puccinia triticina (isolate 1-1 / race 1 (BBBD)) TaxID=630390 RepID=A0A180G5U2_PUCT1|nr:hypothetical protein PTTG_29215 [Puccinia triticina 1-1 BBBD Race 1]